MKAPTPDDYVTLFFNLFEPFQQEQESTTHYGHPFDYAAIVLIVFFTIMMVRWITAFKAQHRWLYNHTVEAIQSGFEQVPHQTTLSRRYKSLYSTLQDLIEFFGVWATALNPEFNSRALI